MKKSEHRKSREVRLESLLPHPFRFDKKSISEATDKEIEEAINLRLNIHNLELHEMLQLPFGIFVMRVDSGWIYDCWDTEKDEFKQGTFVPEKPKTE